MGLLSMLVTIMVNTNDLFVRSLANQYRLD